MTEKRFKDGQGAISVVGENLIFKLLCVIAEENQELRTKNNDCLRHIEVYKEKNNHLKLENEQLKKQLESKEKAHTRCDELYWKLYDENEQLKSFKQRVFDLINKTIEEETQIAENIEEVTQETRPYAKAVNRLTIKTLENLKWELQE